MQRVEKRGKSDVNKARKPIWIETDTRTCMISRKLLLIDEQQVETVASYEIA